MGAGRAIAGDDRASSDAGHMRPYLGSQTSARGAKDNLVHNGSTKAGSEVLDFTLSGLANERSF
jgi:hypothetical protein